MFEHDCFPFCNSRHRPFCLQNFLTSIFHCPKAWLKESLLKIWKTPAWFIGYVKLIKYSFQFMTGSHQVRNEAFLERHWCIRKGTCQPPTNGWRYNPRKAQYLSKVWQLTKRLNSQSEDEIRHVSLQFFWTQLAQACNNEFLKLHGLVIDIVASILLIPFHSSLTEKWIKYGAIFWRGEAGSMKNFRLTSFMALFFQNDRL